MVSWRSRDESMMMTTEGTYEFIHVPSQHTMSLFFGTYNGFGSAGSAESAIVADVEDIGLHK